MAERMVDLIGVPRELASNSVPREIAEEHQAGRVFTEGEMYALVADNVNRETSTLTATVASLTTERAELQNQLDLAVSAGDVERARADQAEADLVAHKAEVEAEKARLALEGTRRDQVRAAAPHLVEEFFTQERASRWAGMSEESFADLLASFTEQAASAPVAPVDPGKARETAMSGNPAGGSPSNNMASLFGLRFNMTSKGA